MTTLTTPYSGSLLRLAVTTIVILAVFAAALSFWQEYTAAAHDRPAPPSAAVALR